MPNPTEVVSHLRNSFNNGKTKPLEFRAKQLKGLIQMYQENENKILAALYADLRKGRNEAIGLEMHLLVSEAQHALYNLYKWNAPEYVEREIAYLLDTAYIQRDPYGVALIVGSWNYPIHLIFMPLAGAIAAGNCVILKPSELAPNCSKLVAEIVPKYLDGDCYAVFTGGIPETNKLLEERFDYIFFTGGTAIGKIFHAAANKFLTPCTLELGGKSPCYVDNSVNFKTAARRILWGKTANVGQTCVAPDYVLCTKEVETKFIAAYKQAIKDFFGENPKESPDMCRIINEAHFDRIVKLLKSDGNIKVGGDYDRSEKYIAPTVLTDVTPKSEIMQQEIFGPILPILNIDNVKEAIDVINSREKPLALYIFSNIKRDVDLILKNTSSGSVCVNDVMMQLGLDTLPFGGVGMSGMGTYHGKFSFDTFSHKKSILWKDMGILGETLGIARYPPYTWKKLAYLRFMLTKRPWMSLGFSCSNVLSFVAGFTGFYLYQLYLAKTK